MTTVEFIANVGGLFGLCMGFSFISFTGSFSKQDIWQCLNHKPLPSINHLLDTKVFFIRYIMLDLDSYPDISGTEFLGLPMIYEIK